MSHVAKVVLHRLVLARPGKRGYQGTGHYECLCGQVFPGKDSYRKHVKAWSCDATQSMKSGRENDDS